MKNSLRNLKILIVEDDRVNQKVTTGVLRRYQCKTTIANDGSEAIQLVRDNVASPFDVILMDIQMPNMDGFEATSKIREIDQQLDRHTPIIALTASLWSNGKEECQQEGMDAFLTKPLNASQLVSTIHRVLDSRLKSAITTSSPELLDDILDRKTLLNSYENDKPFIEELSNMFFDSLDDYMRPIHDSIESGNNEELQNSAHKIKGALSSLFATAAFSAAYALEQIGTDGELTKANDAEAKLNFELARLRIALQELIDEPELLGSSL